MKVSIHLAALAALGLLSFATAANAKITTFNDVTLFDAATTGITSFTFEGYVDPDAGYTNYPDGLTVQGVKFSPASGMITTTSPTYGPPPPFSTTYLSQSNSSAINVTLPAGTTEFGADFANVTNLSSATVTATINGTAYTFSEPGLFGGYAFFGFTSTTPITSLSFTNDLNGTALDNVRFGSIGGAATPEPGSVALLVGMGVTGAGVLRRRRKSLPSGQVLTPYGE